MKKQTLIIIAAATLLFSCAGEAKYGDDLSSNIAAAVKEEAYLEEEASVEAYDVVEDKKAIDIPARQLKNIERKLIKQGSISFETDDCKKTQQLITQVTKSLNGYLSNDNQYSYSDRIQHSITIRVPSDNFDKLLEQISQSVVELEDQNISVQDVTEEFVDVQARLKAKKAVEKRYLELLNKANSVGDILQVENELARLREQIEATEGRLRYLKDQVSLSTLSITYYQITEKGFGFGKKAKKGAENGWKGLLWFFIGLINIWPFVLIITIGVWLLVRFIRRKMKK